MPRDTRLEPSRKKTGDLSFLIQTASALYLFERFDAARDVLDLARHLFPSEPRPLELSALIALRCNDLEGAQAILFVLNELGTADPKAMATLSAQVALRE